MEDTLPKLVREISAIRSQYDQLFMKSQKAQRLFAERDSLQRQQISSLSLQNEELKSKLHDLRQTVKKNFQSQISYNEDVKELEKLARVQEARIVELEDQVLVISSEKTKLSREIALKSDDNEYLKQDIARLKQKLDEDVVSRSEYDIGITKFEQLQSSIDENMITKVKYNQLEDNYRDLKETFNQKVQAVSTEKENLENNFKSTKEIKELLSARLAETEANLEKCMEKLTKIEKENTAYRFGEIEHLQIISDKGSMLENLSQENKCLQENLNKVEFAKTNLMTQISALKQQSKRDADQIKLLNQSKLEFVTIESDLSDSIKKLSVEKADQARKIASLENFNEQLKMIVNQMTDKAKYFEMQLLSLHQAVVDSEGDNENFNDSNIHSESPLLSSSVLSRSADSFNVLNTSSNFPYGDLHKRNETILTSTSTFIPHDL